MKTILQSLGLGAALLLAAKAAPAANYEWRLTTLANGGGTSAGGGYSFTYTIGQPTLGTVSGGRYTARVGFWEQATALTTVTPLPDLYLSSSLETVVLTENITRDFTFTVGNRGAVDATEIQLVVGLPDGVRATAATSSAGACQVTASNVTCSAARLTAQGTFTVDLTLRARFLPESSDLEVRLDDLLAVAASAEADLVPADNRVPVPVTVLAQLDWTDAGDGFPVKFAENGPRHRYSTNAPWLGVRWDNDGTTGIHTEDADWDDESGASDDEDGIEFTAPLVPGATVSLIVPCSRAAGFLSAWADFNNNHSWADVGEQIFTNQPVLPGPNTLTFAVPLTAVPGQITTRWRVNTTGGLSYAGYGGPGEVEDHMALIEPPVATPLVLHYRVEGTNLVLSWDNAQALLEESSRVTGPFTTVPGAVSPFTVPAAPIKFYRLRLGSLPFEIPTTGQTNFYGNSNLLPSRPLPGQAFYGEDAQFKRAPMIYTDNGDGTVTDNTTGLTWQQDLSGPMSWDDAVAGAATFTRGGRTDWRLPSVKELYSLFDARGVFGPNALSSKPFIDTNLFEFFYVSGTRFFDVQIWTDTEYVSTTMDGDPTVFGVNFADGRIKGYPKVRPGKPPGAPPVTNEHYVRYVRGNLNYGKNQFVDLKDGTVFDVATGLMWQKTDSGTTMNWKDALAYATNLSLAGHTDWRVPNMKELQSIVDYTRAPLVTGTAAIDTNFFHVTTTESFYWSSTTLQDGAPGSNFDKAAYLAFGQAFGYMTNSTGCDRFDVHGAGAQRADFKSGDPSTHDCGFGPQGDEVRIQNYVRCVRGGLR